MDTQHDDHTETNDSVPAIGARRVDESQRPRTLPRYFGDRMIKFESTVYDFMHRFAPDYLGGFWQFYDLSNGGFYMAPDRGTYRLRVDSNGYEGDMSADAAGITVCLFTCSHLSFHDARNDLFAERFHQLREFVTQHSEAAEILAAID
jgi:hypothetical protein